MSLGGGIDFGYTRLVIVDLAGSPQPILEQGHGAQSARVVTHLIATW